MGKKVPSEAIIRGRLRTLTRKLEKIRKDIGEAAVLFEDNVYDPNTVQNLMWINGKLNEASETMQDNFGEVKS